MTAKSTWWPPVFEDGVDPAYQTLSIEVFFTKSPAAPVKRALLETMPPPFREWGRWVGPLLHAHSGEWPEEALRQTYGEAHWEKFWADIEQWLKACAKAGAMFIVASAKLEITGYAAALKRGASQVAVVLVPHLTRLFASGVGKGKDAILFGNVTGAIASEAAGCNDDERQLDEVAKENLRALAKEALARKSPTKGWWTDVLDVVGAPPKPTKPGISRRRAR